MIPSDRHYVFSDLIKRLHPIAGKQAAAHWKLPDPVQISCAYYSSHKETFEYRKEVNMTYLSARLATWSFMNEKESVSELTDSITKD